MSGTQFCPFSSSMTKKSSCRFKNVGIHHAPTLGLQWLCSLLMQNPKSVPWPPGHPTTRLLPPATWTLSPLPQPSLSALCPHWTSPALEQPGLFLSLALLFCHSLCPEHSSGSFLSASSQLTCHLPRESFPDHPLWRTCLSVTLPYLISFLTVTTPRLILMDYVRVCFI